MIDSNHGGGLSAQGPMGPFKFDIGDEEAWKKLKVSAGGSKFLAPPSPEREGDFQGC